MSHGTMKPIGATALVLTVINLLAVSSSSEHSSLGTTIDTSRLETTPEQTKPSDSSSNVAIITSPTAPSSTIAVAEKTVPSTSPPNVTSPGPSDSQTHPTPDSSTKSGNDSAVNSSTIASAISGASSDNDTASSDNDTISSSIKPTDAKHEDEITTASDNVVPSSAAPSSPEKATIVIKEQGFTARPDKNQIDGPNKGTPKSHKGVIVPVVVCVVAGIAVVLLVFLYKMCQKKPAVPERMEEVKPTDQTKENVKLLSVKTSPPTSDAKRTPSSQMESIEC